MRILSFLFVVVFAACLQGQEISDIQQSMVTKVTATWCPKCGSWGWDAFSKLLADNNESALLISCHSSGDLDNPTSRAMVENFGGSGQPLFYLNNDNQNISSNNIEAKTIDIKNKILAHAETKAVANSNFITMLEDDQLTVTARTKFFQDTAGDFYLAIYIVEDDVINDQAARGSDVSHKNVLRGGMSDNHFGELIVSGSVTADSEFTEEFSLTLPQAWNIDNIHLAAVIWRWQDGSYHYVNSFVNREWQSTTSIDDLVINNEDLTVWTIENGLYVKLQPGTDFEPLQYQIFTNGGQLIAEKKPHPSSITS